MNYNRPLNRKNWVLVTKESVGVLDFKKSTYHLDKSNEYTSRNKKITVTCQHVTILNMANLEIRISIGYAQKLCGH